MKKTLSLALIIILICLMLMSCQSMDDFIELSNTVCIDQRFESPQLAIEGMEKEKRDNYSIEIDYCPHYELVYSFEYQDNTIVFYSYCYSYDGAKSSDYAIRILRHNEDGTYTFTGGFADFELKEPSNNPSDMFYYYYTNITTNDGVKSISFLYLEKDSDKNVYVDGNICEKVLVTMEEKEFYLCYAISRRDTFLSNLLIPMPLRHRVKIK